MKLLLKLNTVNLYNNSVALQHAIECCPGELILVQEPPHITSNAGVRSIPQISGYRVFGWGRAAILCPNALTKSVTLVSVSDCLVTILLSTGTSALTITSYYHDQTTAYHRLPGMPNDPQVPFITGGDFNAHNEMWTTCPKWTRQWSRGNARNEM